MMNVFLSKYLLFFIISISRLVSCYPYEAYSINKQYPPVARINETFNFQISNDTYKSNNGVSQISYQVYGLPTWLSFTSDTRTFSGTPPSKLLSDDIDKLYFPIILEGTDEADNIGLNNTYQLVVSKKTSIEVASDFNLLALLKNYGYTNGADGLILSPYEIFNVTFDRSTFTDEQEIVAYYGRSRQYNAPLPSWLFFDPNTLKFSGTAPVANSQIAPQIGYEFTLIATDIENYSAVEVPFSLVIGAHALTTSIQNTLVVNITDTRSFSYDIPLNYIYLDGDEINTNNISRIALNDSPSWVKIDNYTVEGTVPADTDLSKSETFSLAIYDIFGDVIYLNFEIMSTTNLFAVNSLPNINATRGEWFQYNFLPSQFTEYSNTNVTVEYTNNTEDFTWLSFHASNLTLYGNVPEDFSSVSLNLVAEQNSRIDKLGFRILGTNPVLPNNTTNHNITTSRNSSSTTRSSSTLSSLASSSSSSSSSSSVSETSSISASTAQSTESTTNGPVSANSEHSSSKKAVAIGCGVGVPVGLIVICIIIFLFWRKSHKKDKNVEDTEKGQDPKGPGNGPVTGSQDDSDATIDPFSDVNAKRMDVLNAIKLDNISSSSESDNFTLDEKKSHHSIGSSGNVYFDASNSPSTEMLLGKPDNYSSDDVRFNRTSSLYLNSEPASRKSWRFNPDRTINGNNREIRDSYVSLNTVSTDEFLNTELSNEDEIEKDPRKSALGLRDSMFNNRESVDSKQRHSSRRYSSKYGVLPALDEAFSHSEYTSEGTMSTSSSDQFIPIKSGERYKWVTKNEPDRKPSKKKYIDLHDGNNIDIQRGLEIEGHSPEKL
ncbi:hypothetical protein Kpol_1020p39 [Vanderwaltozyma polyspora DSM 70294]|uniref:Dystroglycan-type cadherin-like domain-containing protein n=1 Tax=Vanderwaltozyma polyspora (strain ATCC 22028 / DSM 70294 / BCRC 21397 / CBS 2163 / NBRC 10782 / NRRL Y-8283 / UCD 57-17) TaxID=436907 RepID=A7TLE9_VANPO|nr:uncharacterized protein Kpol_1020p39 [Vanderwaltozyma polyspora DSM 70294]EDO16930.1 hypothetical protein Kpol_1020p39 [Vanderwaltozyma polyspora DSM 70294]